jgi:hypothetical protein
MAHPPCFAVCCHFTFNNPFHMVTLHFTDCFIINILHLSLVLIICLQKGRFVWPWKHVISFGWVMLHTVGLCWVFLSFLSTFHMMRSFPVIVIFFCSLTHTLCIVWNKKFRIIMCDRHCGTFQCKKDILPLPRLPQQVTAQLITLHASPCLHLWCSTEHLRPRAFSHDWKNFEAFTKYLLTFLSGVSLDYNNFE